MHERTEGWAAGLRLAALSLSGHPDPAQFAAEFSGSERTVADYLLAEVLERQSEEVRRLLLRTSVLDQVSGELADVLTGRPGGARVLQELEAVNAFVVERHARERTAHVAFISQILRLLAGAASPEADESAPQSNEPPSLREPLSPAEIRVLRYLPTSLTVTEIAEQLYLSVNTVRTHLRHVYDKLDAHRRHEALEQARALGLLAPSSRGT